MFITVHTSTALVLGTLTGSPALGFLYGFFSHFILDVIPHGDTEMAKSEVNPKTGIEEFINKKERNLFLGIALIDNLIALSLVLVLYFFTPFDLIRIPVLLALFGAVLPDVIRGMAIFFQPQWLILYAKFHDSLHFIIPKKISFASGIILQSIIIGISLYFIL